MQIMPEALTHAVMPWAMVEGRMRQMLLFRFEPQHTGTLPPELPPEVLARLSDQTKELMAFAHISHTKEVAAGWRDSFLSRDQPASSQAKNLIDYQQPRL